MSKNEIRLENARMREALRKIRDTVDSIPKGIDPASVYYWIGKIDATAAIALGEAIYLRERA